MPAIRDTNVIRISSKSRVLEEDNDIMAYYALYVTFIPVIMGLWWQTRL